MIKSIIEYWTRIIEEAKEKYKNSVEIPELCASNILFDLLDQSLTTSAKSIKREEKLIKNEIGEIHNIINVEEKTSLDLLIIMDTTASMDPYLSQVKNNLVNIINKIVLECPGIDVNIGFIGYKDVDHTAKYADIDFTKNYEELKQNILNFIITGGLDDPEDVERAMEMALNKTWKNNARFAILVGDNPCHGDKYHSPTLSENYHQGLPNRKNIEESIKELAEKNVSLLCMKITENTDTINGECKHKGDNNNNFFTPDGKKCFLCNNQYFGMPGCKGSCTFSNKRKNVIECEEGKCKDGYLETEKGLCEPCFIVNEGCKSCYYDSQYPDNFSGFRRKRRFICKECEEGYILSNDGWCYHCRDLGFKNCERCIIDKNNFDEFVCNKCSIGYFLNNQGYCDKCESPKVQGIHNTCVNCNDIDEGGIDGCDKCVSDDGKITCQQCKEGFILNEKSGKCLKISDNKQLQKFINCQRVLINDDKFYCSKCYDNYNLLKENSQPEPICVNNNYIVSPKSNILKYCKDSINNGTDDRPMHSCNKCIGNNELTQAEREEGISYTRIIYSENYTAYCDLSNNYKSLVNCTKAFRKVPNNTNNLSAIYSCQECAEGNILVHYIDLPELEYCKYIHYEKTCMVKYCKTCRRGNNYFCEECMLEDYEVNPASGACIKKMEKVPMITWKDIFRITLNSNMNINGQEISGLKMIMRGITTDEIVNDHAFLVTVTLKIFSTRRNLRNIEEKEEKVEDERVKTICVVRNSTDKSNSDLNLVEYECIGNRTEKDYLSQDNVILGELKAGYGEDSNNNDNDKNKEFTESSNLADIFLKTNLEEIRNKTESSYTFEDLLKTSTFTLEDIVNQVSDSYDFDIKLNGKINRDLPPQTIDGKLKIKELKNKTADCQIIIGEKKNAVLQIKANLEGYEELKQFSFKTTEVGGENNTIYLSHLDEVKLVHKDKEEIEEKKKADIIKIVLIVAAVVLVVGAVVGIILLKKFLSKKNKNKDETSDKKKVETADTIKNSENVNAFQSTNRKIKPQK